MNLGDLREAPACNDGSGEEMRRNGRIGGALFGLGAVASVPASLMMDPRPPPDVYLLTVAAMLTGIACLRIPWERLPPSALNGVVGLAVVEVALACVIVDESFRSLYFVPSVYAALVLTTRLELTTQLVFISTALLVPIAYEPEVAREHARVAILTIPVVAIVAGVVRYQREALAARERALREFGSEAIQLAIRIKAPDDERIRLQRLSGELRTRLRSRSGA